jgi:uncharacterized membrane protein YphA (DoxX/SURF4 family)
MAIGILNIGFLFRLIFQLALGAYFLSHGISLSLPKTIDQNVELINNNLNTYIGQLIPIVITKYCVEVYGHVEVVLGFIIVLGWKISKVSVMFYLVNCVVLFESRNKVILGVQIMVMSLIIGISL